MAAGNVSSSPNVADFTWVWETWLMVTLDLDWSVLGQVTLPALSPVAIMVKLKSCPVLVPTTFLFTVMESAGNVTKACLLVTITVAVCDVADCGTVTVLPSARFPSPTLC